MEALIATVISVLVPYLVKGGEAFAEEAGKQSFAGVKALVDRLAKWWNKNDVAAAAVKSLPQAPATYSKILADMLALDLAKDPTFAAELSKLVKDAGPIVDVVQKVRIAHDLTGADIGTLIRGHVRVEQQVEYGEKVTGVKIDRIG
ncbi:hypothetical protein [Peristeroidobacter soli]|uniref:hypothetical protein n=1 Tax=Peristeroidobacter soli TaxID=2497877 RepID=UPI00101C1D47|nr:hypothetical protein [Peristeroidobacter soli]